MKTVVISGFYDKLDKKDGARLGHHYEVNDIYPRDGVETTEERIEELQKGGFLAGVIVGQKEIDVTASEIIIEGNVADAEETPEDAEKEESVETPEDAEEIPKEPKKTKKSK